ncbi:alpha/beta hydrolase [Saxibacter everestensis]|uniref:Alpha/beta hydrolase n=1 Tax=Saxibacter everestensis TaxID=2909229 RepID=A0ABY8R0G4_9MICO|nr:alpha/beta hydrolase [Brevibacteriaceae bacterium ZFBP1038]
MSKHNQIRVPVAIRGDDQAGTKAAQFLSTDYWIYGEGQAIAAHDLATPFEAPALTEAPAPPHNDKPAPDDDPPTVIMVHGFRGDHHGLELIAQALTPTRVISPDLPGFGRTGPLPTPHTLKGYVDFLRAFIRELDLATPPVVVGHSFGSIVAAGFAAEYPEALSKLVLINPIASPALEGPQKVLTLLTVFYYRLATALPAAPGLELLRNRLIVRLMSIVMAKTKDPELRQYIHGQHDAHFSSFSDRQTLLEAFTTSIQNTATQSAADIKTPTLLIASERDDISSLPAQEALHASIVDSRLIVIPRAGHLVHYEAPQHAAAAIQEFITA